MYKRKTTTLTQSLLLAALLSNVFIVSACSAESSNIPALSNKSTPAEIYELGLAYYEGDSVTEDDDKAFELFQKAADQGNQEASNRIGKLVMNGKIDDKGITIFSTQETGLTLGDITGLTLGDIEDSSEN